MQIKAYENAEEMFADLDEQRKQAIESFNNCTNKQKALKEEDVFITIAEGLVIFNQIQILDPDDEREFKTTKEAGYVMVKAWSSACPEGEMGSVHRSRAILKVVDSRGITSMNVLRTFIGLFRKYHLDVHSLPSISRHLEVLV